MLPELRKYQDELEAEASSLVDKWDEQFMHDRNRTALFANQNAFLGTHDLPCTVFIKNNLP